MLSNGIYVRYTTGVGLGVGVRVGVGVGVMVGVAVGVAVGCSTRNTGLGNGKASGVPSCVTKLPAAGPTLGGYSPATPGRICYVTVMPCSGNVSTRQVRVLPLMLGLGSL